MYTQKIAKKKLRDKCKNLSRGYFYFFFVLTDAFMNSVNSGCGASGRAWNSGWNWTARKNGWILVGSSMISISLPSGDVPENFRSFDESFSMNCGFTSYRCLCRSSIVSVP